MAKTLYDMLEVAPAASPETIVAAYRSLIGRYHPDKVAALGADLQTLAVERSKEINLAYETLRDPGRRAAYDRELRSAQAQPAQTAPPPPPPRDDDFAPREDWTRAAAEDTTEPPLTRWETTRLVLQDLRLNTRSGPAYIVTGLVLVFLIRLVSQYGFNFWGVTLIYGPASYCIIIGVFLIFSGALIALTEIGPKTRKGLLVIRMLLLLGSVIGSIYALRDIFPVMQGSELTLAAFLGAVGIVLYALLGLTCISPRAGHWLIRGFAGTR